MNARINIPLDAIGDPLAPWNQPEHYEGIPHKCDWDCGTEVDEVGQVCDPCLVDNAETCGDWDEEAARALARIKTRELHERVKALEDALYKLTRACPSLSCDNFSHDSSTYHKWDEVCKPHYKYVHALTAAELLLNPISEAHAHLITQPK